MRKTIVRTLSTSTINAYTMKLENGQAKVETLEPLTVAGKVTEEKAMKLLKDKYGKNFPVAIADINVQEDMYEISVNDFVKYAKKVSKVSECSETKKDSSEDSETSNVK